MFSKILTWILYNFPWLKTVYKDVLHILGTIFWKNNLKISQKVLDQNLVKNLHNFLNRLLSQAHNFRVLVFWKHAQSRLQPKLSRRCNQTMICNSLHYLELNRDISLNINLNCRSNFHWSSWKSVTFVFDCKVKKTPCPRQIILRFVLSHCQGHQWVWSKSSCNTSSKIRSRLITINELNRIQNAFTRSALSFNRWISLELMPRLLSNKAMF